MTAAVVKLDEWRAERQDWSLQFFNGPGSRDKRDAVAIYAKLGLHAILLHGVAEDGTCTCGRDCGTVGKHPCHKGWQTAPLDLRSLDQALMRNWRLNVGLRMGLQPNGWRLITIDVDGSRSLLEPLEAQNGALPETLTSRTSKGLHLIYRLPEGLEVKNKIRLAPGIDVRSEGGQIVAPPSRHVSGEFYQWITVRAPAELPA